MHSLKNLTVIILLLHRSCLPREIDPVPPRSLATIGAYITLYGYAFKGPKLERRTSRSMLHCSHLCLKNSRCFSFNYQVTLPRNGLCELSEEGILSKERREMLKKRPGFLFVQTGRKDLLPMSCLEYVHAGRRYSGLYNLYDFNRSSFRVYCDLTFEPRAAWTLFMSERTPGNGLFSRVPLFVDKPTNESKPNWNAFRLSLSHMNQLRYRSSHWRITCSFQLDGLVLRDYVLAKVVDFDPIDFKGKRICKKVEYINVRGHNCSDCYAAWWQGDNAVLSHDSSNPRCGFDPSSGAVRSEDDFGLYQYINPTFRCTQSGRESTTNYWFGSYLGIT